MRCAFCGGYATRRTVQKMHRFKGKTYLIKEVPAEVCTECGERYFHATTLDAIDQMIEAGPLVQEVLQVDVLEFQPA